MLDHDRISPKVMTQEMRKMVIWPDDTESCLRQITSFVQSTSLDPTFRDRMIKIYQAATTWLDQEQMNNLTLGEICLSKDSDSSPKLTTRVVGAVESIDIAQEERQVPLAGYSIEDVPL